MGRLTPAALVFGGLRVRSLLVLGMAAIAACAKIADLEGSDPPAAAGSDGGALPTTPEGIAVSPATLDIATACGVTSDASPISIANTGAQDAPYEVKVPEGSVLMLRDDKGAVASVVSGVVAVGQVAQVSAVVTSTRPGTTDGDVFVTAAGRLQVVKARMTINGAAISLTPALVDFGEVRQATEAPPQTVEIENTGNEAVTIEGWTSSAPTADAGEPDFTMSSGSITIPPGEKRTATATFVPKPAGPEVSVELTPKTTGTLCGDPPKLRLEGTRVSTDVTVNPGAIDFGDVDCNAVSSATRTVTISNYASQAVTANVTLPQTSWFTTVGALPVAIPAKDGSSNAPKTATITFALKQLPSALEEHKEQLSIALTGPEPTPKIVNARVRTVGAILEVAPKTLGGFTPGQTKEFDIRNTGNDFIYFRVESSNPAAFQSSGEGWLYDDTEFFARVAKVKFVATTPGTHTADITVSRIDTRPTLPPLPKSSALCNAPVVVTVSATHP